MRRSQRPRVAKKRVTFQNQCSTTVSIDYGEENVPKQQAQDPELLQETSNCKGCPVCRLELPNLTETAVNAVTSCGHVMCFECALRCVFIVNQSMKDDIASCPICSHAMSKVILTRQTFESPKNVKHFLARSTEKSSNVKLFFKNVFYDDDDLYDLIKGLLWFQCNSCNMDFSRHQGIFKTTQSVFNYVSKHLKDKHDTYLCDLCFFNLELFPIELEFFSSSSDLRHHKRDGFKLGDTFVKHQRCLICQDPDGNYNFFDEKAQLAHLKKEHISCSLCFQQNTFFRDKVALDKHVTQEHMCTEENANPRFTYCTVLPPDVLIPTSHPKANISLAPCQSSATNLDDFTHFGSGKSNDAIDLVAGFPVGRGKPRRFAFKQ